MSTASMTAMEEVADQAGGRLWFQLYVWKRRDLSYQVIERAQKAGYEALVVTVDSAVSPNREYNARNGFAAPLKPNFRMAVDIALHPTWSLGVMGRYLRTTGMPKQENFPPEFQELDHPRRRRPSGRDAPGFADLGGCEDIPQNVAGFADAERRQPRRRRAEGDQLRR